MTVNKSTIQQRAILYARVSTDRQAEQGFSREEQIKRLRAYCEQNDIIMTKEFLEDYSAKNFKRPAFTQILKELKEKTLVADLLIVPKIDRFTRNLKDTFQIVSELEKYHVTVYSLAEGEMDFENPHKFFPLIVQTGAAEYDNMIRSQNTVRGMRQAMKSGYCITSKPPIGYIRISGDKIIKIDENFAPAVRFAFEKYAKGIYAAVEVRKEAYTMGLKLEKQAFLNMLKNPLYVGKIFIKATKEEPEQLVPGRHEPIIDEETFYTVQNVLQGKRKPYKQPKSKIADALPLRGHLICPNCGRTLTGSNINNGRSEKRIPYYHCQQKKYGCNCRFNANDAHEAMIEQLKAFEPAQEVTELFIEVVKDIFNDNDKDRLNRKNEIEKQIKTIDERLDRIMDDYADGNIRVTDYNKMKKRFEVQKSELVMQHVGIATVPPDFSKYVSYSCGLMSNLSSYYANASATTQNKLIGLIFPEKLIFTGIEYQTTKLNDIFSLINKLDKGFKENCLTKNARQSIQAPEVGLEPTTL